MSSQPEKVFLNMKQKAVTTKEIIDSFTTCIIKILS